MMENTIWLCTILRAFSFPGSSYLRRPYLTPELPECHPEILLAPDIYRYANNTIIFNIFHLMASEKGLKIV